MFIAQKRTMGNKDVSIVSLELIKIKRGVKNGWRNQPKG